MGNVAAFSHGKILRLIHKTAAGLTGLPQKNLL